MNAFNPPSAAAMQTAVQAFAALPVPNSERVTVDFMDALNAGCIRPAQMVAVIQAMHNCLMDRHEAVATFMTPDLEQIADLLVDAMRCAETNEQDYPEAVEA